MGGLQFVISFRMITDYTRHDEGYDSNDSYGNELVLASYQGKKFNCKLDGVIK